MVRDFMGSIGLKGKIMTTEEVGTCPICSCPEGQLVFCARDRSYGHPGTFQVMDCKNCSVKYVFPRLSMSEVTRYYSDANEPDAYHASPGWKRWLEGKRFDNQIQRLERELSRYIAGGRLLDVGCGRGEFLYGMAKRKRWEVQGLEMNPKAGKLIADELGIPVYIGTLEKALPANARFDVITLWDVFEHFSDPVPALQRLRSALNDDGLLVVKMPNPESLGAKIFGASWYGWSVPQHYFAWPSGIFMKFVQEHGFRVVEAKYLYGGFSDFLTSIQFTFAGIIPYTFLRKAVRILSTPVVEFAVQPFIHLEAAIGRPSSFTYFLKKTV